MSAQTRISAAFEDALRLPLDSSSRYIVFSDCHRSTGKANDNYLKNEYLFLAAMSHYLRNGFTYLELGDGDELWENRSIEKIEEVHENSFAVMSHFCCENRMYSVYGNHDITKKNLTCTGFRFYSGIILEDCRHKKDIYLTHGHQASILNSTLWPFAHFLVRCVWSPLEQLGIPDPTSAAKNNTRKNKTEKTLTHWAKTHNHILITGHTHRPMIGTRDAPYCNSGSCVHPAGITGIEIQNRCMTLVKWSIGAREDLTLYAKREVLGKTVCVDDYC